ncbi:MAG: hypothetical protein ABIY63_13315 [Fibrobacteria bacterium]
MPIHKVVIWVLETKYETPEQEARGYHPGDVVQVLPRDHVFGKEEIKNPLWKIVEMDIPSLEAMAMESEEHGDYLAKPILRRREFHFHFDKMPRSARQKLERAPTGKHITLNAVEMAGIRAAKTRKAPMVDRQTIAGRNRQVIA